MKSTTRLARSVVYTAAMPPVMFERCIAAPSLIAHIASRKFCEGMPLFRIEDSFAREGIALDRGLMSRWLEILGGTQCFDARGSWVQYLANDVLEKGEEHNGVDPKYRGYNEGPKV